MISRIFPISPPWLVNLRCTPHPPKACASIVSRDNAERHGANDEERPESYGCSETSNLDVRYDYLAVGLRDRPHEVCGKKDQVEREIQDKILPRIGLPFVRDPSPHSTVSEYISFVNLSLLAEAAEEVARDFESVRK